MLKANYRDGFKASLRADLKAGLEAGAKDGAKAGARVDFKKDFKELYLPKQMPVLIDVPPMTYLTINGKGGPSEEEYQQAIPLLYSLSYVIKMNGKDLPGYYDYTVFPLEGLWWIAGAAFSLDTKQRENWLWTSLIRQPDFVTPEVFQWAIDTAKKKKPGLDFAKVRLETLTEGLCVQMMHVGPYSAEPKTLDMMRTFMGQNGLTDATGSERKHHEIYLSDPNRTAPERLRTVLRLPVEK